MTSSDDRYVVYHPKLAFMVDEDGAWSTDRDQAHALATHADAVVAIKVAVGNGLRPEVAARCQILLWE